MWDIALCVCMFKRFMGVVVRVSCALPGVILMRHIEQLYFVNSMEAVCLLFHVMTGNVDTSNLGLGLWVCFSL